MPIVNKLRGVRFWEGIRVRSLFIYNYNTTYIFPQRRDYLTIAPESFQFHFYCAVI